MCLLLKRAVLLSRLTLRDGGVSLPDAIVSGTGLGCINNTEKFLWSIMQQGEQCLQPTFFMQSTHNVISSTIAIDLKCHSYNNTFVHRGVSFENALLDACLQLQQGRASNVLVGGYDELTDHYYVFFKRIGMFDFAEQALKPCFAGEAAVSMLVSAEKTDSALCRIEGIELLRAPSPQQYAASIERLLRQARCSLNDIDAVMTGLNTVPDNDAAINVLLDRHFKDIPVLQYKHLFGESFSASALGINAAITCLHKGYAPAFLFNNERSALTPVKRIVIVNHYRKSHSLILLSSCSV